MDIKEAVKRRSDLMYQESKMSNERRQLEFNLTHEILKDKDLAYHCLKIDWSKLRRLMDDAD